MDQHVRLNLRIPHAQHDALKRESARTGASVQSLVRRGIVSVTGEADTIHSTPRRAKT